MQPAAVAAGGCCSRRLLQPGLHIGRPSISWSISLSAAAIRDADAASLMVRTQDEEDLAVLVEARTRDGAMLSQLLR